MRDHINAQYLDVYKRQLQDGVFVVGFGEGHGAHSFTLMKFILFADQNGISIVFQHLRNLRVDF